ncbi:MAG: hypothetical protein Q9190_000023 [Brigantiaea leucoxantha]
MPRFVAPPPSGEFSVSPTKPFTQTPTEKIEIFGEPNRPSTIKTSARVGAENQNIIIKDGSLAADDVNELLSLVRPLGGLPTSPDKDIYGLDARLVMSTFEVQWDNGEEVEGAEAEVNPTEENKQTFKDVLESIEALARQKAKNRIS